ncbi:hypothetical protein [Streptomyces sp. MA5143a]|uniref:hypothetical protein n=1 Tax=Streptomyces sp. MA5143a TaxID=2083010 RepID=UPI000D1B871B|nr:hypothetical protein [Streptomyces sp. MA5143a]SPF00259.1 hypothetical protein SMA5143A_0970 [Streptomyces sp. MA5143a]
MRSEKSRKGVLIGVVAGVGCLLVAPVLLIVGALTLMLLGRALAPLPIPDGEALALRDEQILGTWRDDSGGLLVLREDGTFTSDGVCGDFKGDDLAATAAPDPGSGTWEHRESEETETDTPMSEVHLTFTPSEVWTRYEARGTSRKAVLWAFVGDPDSGDVCVLDKVRGTAG